MAYYRKQDYDHAISDNDFAIGLDRGTATAWNNRCLAYLDQASYEKAISDCTEAIRLRPSDESYLNRGLAYSRKGDTASALIDFNQVRRQGSSEANRKRAETFAKQLDSTEKGSR